MSKTKHIIQYIIIIILYYNNLARVSCTLLAATIRSQKALYLISIHTRRVPLVDSPRLWASSTAALPARDKDKVNRILLLKTASE